jgi:hypothetical protein
MMTAMVALRTENYATTKRNEIQACSDVVGTCAFLPTPKGGGFSESTSCAVLHHRYTGRKFRATVMAFL